MKDFRAFYKTLYSILTVTIREWETQLLSGNLGLITYTGALTGQSMNFYVSQFPVQNPTRPCQREMVVGGRAKDIKVFHKYSLLLDTVNCSSNNSPSFFLGNKIRFILDTECLVLNDKLGVFLLSFLFFATLGIKPRILSMPGNHSATGLQSQPSNDKLWLLKAILAHHSFIQLIHFTKFIFEEYQIFL